MAIGDSNQLLAISADLIARLDAGLLKLCTLIQSAGAANGTLSDDDIHLFPLLKQASPTLTLAKVLTDLLVMANEHLLTMPPDLMLLLKAPIAAGSVLHRLDPPFDLIATLKPILKQAMLQC